ncbi:chaperone required for assembly of F1-ATPase [Hasllibacter halocynthiae]|uniref:Chaperone required for assembly of F1-ATPase n=1 Tax=Hasllibacter halocynthiae TaxID=595589 RepID=A0A2T0X3I3_9RHOB|nr:ATP12 family protein [Hasllibacter halocynthiae]PRY93512.1 chaperone required for assembly of F1-ATPase [Hasllibacter halocynthiae]
MSEWKAKRFWKAVETADVDGGHEVRLDGRPVRTPAKAPLVLPTPALAAEVAREWDAVGETIDPGAMLATRAANSAIDKAAPQREALIDELAGFGETDLLSYRAAHPEGLVARQAAEWDPLLDWAEARFGARLRPVTGVMFAPQRPEALAALRAPLEASDAFGLTALSDLVALSGSLVIGLRAAEGDADVEGLWQVSRLDERWQAELWGADDEAEADAARRGRAFAAAARFHALSRS